MNFLELQTAVANRIHRTDLTTEIQEFLAIAHSRLQTDIEDPESKKYLEILSTSFTEIPNTAMFETPLPADCLRVTGVTFDGYYLDSTTPAQLHARSHSRSAARANFYAIQGVNLWVAPVAGDVGLWYKSALPFFTGDTDDNGLSRMFPQLYIYGAIVEAQHFTQDVEELQKATNLYDAELRRVNKHYNRLATGGSPATQAV